MIFTSWLTGFYIADEGQEITNDDAPEKNPQYTTVYVGNLAPEARISIFSDSFYLNNSSCLSAFSFSRYLNMYSMN